MRNAFEILISKTWSE